MGTDEIVTEEEKRQSTSVVQVLYRDHNHDIFEKVHAYQLLDGVLIIAAEETQYLIPMDTVLNVTIKQTKE